MSLGVQSGTVLAACALVAVRARRARGRLRAARALLSAPLAFATLAGVLALVLPLITGEVSPTPSLADAAHFLYLPLPATDDDGRALRLLRGVVGICPSAGAAAVDA